ncbi:hypothetical protein yruck0001_3360 [Yersinia ruckeri ATCC 29473]|nr:hypothetical protein yruck0001_3360 [Yersinia ruckeri ATCC 29473]
MKLGAGFRYTKLFYVYQLIVGKIILFFIRQFLGKCNPLPSWLKGNPD